MKTWCISETSPRRLQAILLCLVLAAATLLAGCGGSGSSNSNTTSFATAYAGTWTGNWTDIDGTSGTSTMTITLNTATKAASVQIALSGNQFGFAGSQTALTGTYDNNSITVAGPSGVTPVATLTIAKSGQFTGLLSNVSSTVTSITYGGPSTSQSVTLNVNVNHTDGTVETGVITLTKPAS